MDSPLNASVLCKVCHDKIGHTKREQLLLFLKTWQVLKVEKIYTPTKYDILFLEEQSKEEFGVSLPDLIKIL